MIDDQSGHNVTLMANLSFSLKFSLESYGFVIMGALSDKRIEL
jgi:hypothetical protein